MPKAFKDAAQKALKREIFIGKTRVFITECICTALRKMQHRTRVDASVERFIKAELNADQQKTDFVVGFNHKQFTSDIHVWNSYVGESKFVLPEELCNTEQEKYTAQPTWNNQIRIYFNEDQAKSYAAMLVVAEEQLKGYKASVEHYKKNISQLEAIDEVIDALNFNYQKSVKPLRDKLGEFDLCYVVSQLVISHLYKDD